MQRKPYLVSRRPQVVSLASIGKPTLSVWQSAVLESARAKSGVTLTSVEQTDKLLRANARNPHHLTVMAVRSLLVVEPPKGMKVFPPASPPTAA